MNTLMKELLSVFSKINRLGPVTKIPPRGWTVIRQQTVVQADNISFLTHYPTLGWNETPNLVHLSGHISESNLAGIYIGMTHTLPTMITATELLSTL